ncbi:hypothetical protein MJ560_05350 [Klebsiella pneumoniae]|nr:hypothetical protein MJ560_05350 [Klebsiella pneumoniae]
MSKFFDEVDHDMLMNRVGRKIKDKALHAPTGKYLRAGIAERETGLWFESTKGVLKVAIIPFAFQHLTDELDKKLTYKHL